MLAHFFGQGVAQGFFHTFSGWVVFVVAFGLLFAEGLCLGALGPRARATGSRQAPQEA